MTSLPNLLTLSRIFAIPVVVALFYIPGEDARWAAAALFCAAAITDYFDGYLARARGLTSSLGRFLDPIADKLLVAASILMLTAFDRIGPWALIPALIILCREILVSGLREFLAEVRVGMPVSRLAKWKTGFQMAALPVLMIGDAGPAELPVKAAGEICLWAAGILTLITGYDYLRAGLAHMQGPDPKP